MALITRSHLIVAFIDATGQTEDAAIQSANSIINKAETLMHTFYRARNDDNVSLIKGAFAESIKDAKERLDALQKTQAKLFPDLATTTTKKA